MFTNRPRMKFLLPPSKLLWPFKILEKSTFSLMFYGKIKKFKTLISRLFKNISRGFTSLKI